MSGASGFSVKTSDGRWRWPVVVGGAVVLLLAVLVFFSTRYVLSDAHLYRRDAASLDLRQETLTPAQYERLQKKLPDCRIRWSIPIGESRYDSAASVIAITDFAADEAPLFALFDDLQRVDAAGCTCWEALIALRALLPELDLRYTVELGGRTYTQSAASLLLPAETSYEELSQRLLALPLLESVRAEGVSLTPAEQAALMEQYPDVLFLWPVALCGEEFSSGSRTLVFSALTASQLEEITANVLRFPRLERIDLSGSGLGEGALRSFADGLPDYQVVWDTALYGVTVSTGAKEIDLSGIPIDDLAPIEDLLPYMKSLKKVVMCDCGPSDEEMDALDQRHPEVRFVWMIHMGQYTLRTDATYYIASLTPHGRLFDDQVTGLRYCRDLIALDMGHMSFTDVSFLYEMPHMKWLILADVPVADATPIGSLKELVYLEIFQSKLTDISPLLGCTSLLDLNICHLPLDATDAIYETLLELDWLERLWYSGNRLTRQQREAIEASNPDCEMYLQNGMESTGATWRTHPRYYEMRDVFGMWYMPGGTN